MYVFDTNVLIYYSKDENRVVSAVEKVYEDNKPVYISAITEAEFFSYAQLTDREIEKIEAFLKTVSLQRHIS